MHLLINGKDYDDLPEGLNVLKLIEHLGFRECKVAIERNREVIPKSEYAETFFENHDELEIIHFIGGG